VPAEDQRFPMRRGPSTDQGYHEHPWPRSRLVADARRRSGPPRPGTGSAGRGRQGRSIPEVPRAWEAPSDRSVRADPPARRAWDRPLLSVDDRCGPMLRARRGHGRRVRRCSKPGGDGHLLGRRVRPVLGDHLPRWQAPWALTGAIVGRGGRVCCHGHGRLRSGGLSPR
jgi:hypothetical protein